MIRRYKLQQNVGNYKSVILIGGLQMFFILKPVSKDLFISIEKYREKPFT